MKTTQQKILKKPFAKKSFGQNFLIDENYINKIISALNPRSGDTIVEIGAGRGALTERLIEKNVNVIAIELESDMIEVLKTKFANSENFTLIDADVLKLEFTEIIRNHKSAKLVANLPYYISTAVLQKLIAEREVFSEMILMFQREVVERITAKAGNSERGFLTVLAEVYLKIEKLFDVSPAAFKPAPKVWSAVVHLTPKKNIEINDAEFFREIVSAAFFQKRKTILNNFKNFKSGNFAQINWLKIFEDSKIETTRRAETLTADEWLNLYKILKVEKDKIAETI